MNPLQHQLLCHRHRNPCLSHAGNHLNQFEDLKLHSKKDEAEVEGIKRGLDIKGTGTFKFHIKDNKGGVHLIKIPNSKYIPDLEMCLLVPHHWAQEAKDHHPVPKGTKAEMEDQELTLLWKQQRHRRPIPYHPFTNTPTFRTALASRTYPAFVALYKAAETQYHQQEHILQMPGQLHHDKEFTAKENVHADILKKTPLVSEGAMRQRHGASQQPLVRKGRQGGKADNKDGSTHL
jgi:hypothetical protein